MAKIESFRCITCHEYVQELTPSGAERLNECMKCKNKKTYLECATFFKGLKSLTLKEKIASIEAWTYDYKPSKKY